MSSNAATSSSAPSGGDAVIYRCASCGQNNRLSPARLREGPVCGKCHQPLLPTKPVAVTDATWSQEVEQSPIPVLVDFWAPWCGPCRAIAPVLDQLAGERAGRLKIVKLNVDENPRSAGRFDVQAIPTMILFRGGKLVDQIRGAVPKPALEARLAQIGV